MRVFLSIQRRLFISHFLVVILVSGSIGTYFYKSAADSLLSSLQARLKNSASLISVSLDVWDLAQIRTEQDMGSTAYEKILGVLREFRRTNPDIAYLYVMRLNGERVEFVVDSDTTDVQAHPGQVYEQAVPALMDGFDRPTADDKIYQDAWGSFLSGYAPVKDGRGEYLVGMDMRADEVARKFRQLKISGGISLAASIVLAIIFSRMLSTHFTTPVRLLIAQCRAIAQGRLDEPLDHSTRDELDDLIGAFNAMSTRLSESRQQQQQAEGDLRAAKQDLELRVAERTKELEETNARLVHEVEERRRVQEALAEAARTDPLTGLLNRRSMTEQMQYQVGRVLRHKQPFVLVLADLDHFKEVNDRYGHAVGDAVLKDVADLIRSSVRREDLVARWGGEEFLILLPDTDGEGGKTLAEKTRVRIKDRAFSSGSEVITMTISLGLAVYSEGSDLDELLQAADRALYQAKEKGRDTVVVAG